MPRSNVSAPEPERWSHWIRTGQADPYRVLVAENKQRPGSLLLTWFWPESGRPRAKRVRHTATLDLSVRTDTGRLNKEALARAKATAQAKYRELQQPPDDEETQPDAPLTVGETAAIVTDPKTGAWPNPTPYRAEVLRHLAFAAQVWGYDKAWDELRRQDVTALGRAAVDAFQKRVARELAAAVPVTHGKRRAKHRKSRNNARHAGGFDTAVKVVKRVVTVANWLRDNERIEPGACVPKKEWLEELKTYWRQKTGAVSVPAPHRPRHTPEEFRAILAAMGKVDPRGFLLLALGAELRSGQVRRTRRSDVELARTDAAPYGQVTVPGIGKKQGETIILTRGQRAALDEALGYATDAVFTLDSPGYLRFYEASYVCGEVKDYHLFPGGDLRTVAGASSWTKRSVAPYAPLPGALEPKERAGVHPVARRRSRPYVSKQALAKWFREAEDLAGVAHKGGRAYYGLRRVATDAGKGEDARTIQALGGWSDITTPTRIYMDSEMGDARKRAADVRAKLRGEDT